jgi:hemerythrin-like domain-containing protein
LSPEILELLMACHSRIRRFTGGLVALCSTPAEDERVVPTAEACLRYFREALPLHAQDEEESLLPRVLALPDPPIQALQAMREQHEGIEALLPRVCGELEAIAGGRALSEPELLERFSGLLLRHIEAEERAIFVRVGELSAEDQQAMVGELRARRGA